MIGHSNYLRDSKLGHRGSRRVYCDSCLARHLIWVSGSFISRHSMTLVVLEFICKLPSHVSMNSSFERGISFFRGS